MCDQANKPGAGEFEASKMSGGMPAGSSRALRLDPSSLPVKFAARDERADGRCREVELTRDRVVLRRAIAGMKMAVNLRSVPIAASRCA